MRICFLGNFSVPYCSEVHHVKSLESLGHHVIRLQETKKSGHQIYSIAKTCDLFVWVHTHGWRTPGLSMKTVLKSLRHSGVKTLTYHLDLWFGLNRQADMKTDDVWDIEHFFTVDKRMADWFNVELAQGRGVTKGHYIQAGVFHDECTLNQPYTNEYGQPDKRVYLPTFDNDIIFVGSKNYHSEWSYRPNLINWLQTTFPQQFKLYGGDGLGVKRGQDLNDLYAKTKVVVGDTLCINYDYPYYWSDRIYETIGRGGFIIHPYIKGIEEHFENGKHCVFYQYGDFVHLQSLIEYYLEHDEEREKIRIAGHEHVKNNHTYKHRWQQILSEI